MGWLKIYFFVIWFRLKFRSLRQMLSNATGIHFFRGRIKLNAVNPGKVHEEEKVIEILDDEAEDMKICDCHEACSCDFSKCKESMTGFGSCIVSIICCPCWAMETMCNACHEVTGIDDVCCGFFLFCMFLVFVYLFAPVILFGLMVLACAVPCLAASDGNPVALVCAIMCATPFFVLLWWGAI